MVRLLVSILTILICILQATNSYILSVNGQTRHNSTAALVLNQVNENHNLSYTQGVNNITGVVRSSLQDYFTHIISQNVDEESPNVHGLRLTRATTRGRGRGRTRSTNRRQTGMSRSHIDCQGQRNTGRCRTQYKCSGKRWVRRSNTRAGLSTRLKSKRNRGMKTTSCLITNTENKETSGRSVEKPNTAYTSVFCPAPNRRRSKRAPNCDPANLSTKNNDKREAIVKEIINEGEKLRKAAGYETVEGPVIFQAIKKIEVGHKITKDDPLIVVNNQDLLTKLEGSSYEKMNQLRKAWSTKKVEATEYGDQFLTQVKDLSEMDTSPLTNAKMKHIFLGEPHNKKQEFSGLHDGSAFYPGAAHNLVGGIVVGVKKIGPGVVVQVMEPVVEWNKDNGDVRRKNEMTMFLGVPPKAQAAFYLTAFYDDDKSGKGSIAVALTDPDQGTSESDLLTIQVNKNTKKNKEIIGNAFPDFMHGEQHAIYQQIKNKLQ